MSVTTNATSAPSKLSTTAHAGSQVSTLLSSRIMFINASFTSLRIWSWRLHFWIKNIIVVPSAPVMFRSLQKKRLGSLRSVWAASLKQMSDAVAAACCMVQTCCRRALWVQSLLTLPWQLEAGGGWAERAASGPREPAWLPPLHCSPLCSLWRTAWWLPTALSRGTSTPYESLLYSIQHLLFETIIK